MMRKPKQPWETDILIKRPIFWTKCEKCGNEFRFEKMYRYVDMRYVGGRHKYGCVNCFEDKMSFWKYVTYIPPAPKCPPGDNRFQKESDINHDHAGASIREAVEWFSNDYGPKFIAWYEEGKKSKESLKGGENNDKDRNDTDSASGT